MKIDLLGQVALVTGGSRGIGAATCKTLAGAGAYVVINYRSGQAEAEQVLADIQAAGGQAEILAFDVVDEDGVKAAVKEIVKRCGRIDILVNNAGISRDALLLRAKSADFDSMVNTNLKGAFLCTFHASRYMLKQKSGRVINISSIVGLGGNAGQSLYAATKAGLVGFTKSLAKELGSRGVLVNAIAPGLIATDMTEGMDSDAINIPLGRMGQPEDVAAAVLFLSSDLSRYMTGQVMVVDGGLYI